MSKNKNEDLEKSARYAAIIMDNLANLFAEESEGFAISAEELEEGENLTHFLNALMNLVPTQVYSNFTGQDIDTLGANHIANRLCVQYMNKEDD